MIRDLARNLRARSIVIYGTRDNPITGDRETYVETSKVHITADEIVLQDHSGSSRLATTIDVTVDIGASGVNGLDSGIKSPSTWYHIWIIQNANGPAKGLLSTSASSPNLPTGFSYKGYVGAVYNNSDDYFISYFQNNKLVWASKSCPLAMAALPNNPTSVDLAASVPSTASSVVIELSGLTTIGGHFISNTSVGPTANGPWHDRWMMVAGSPQGAGAVDHVQFATQCEILLDNPQMIYAQVGTADDLVEIKVLGWRY